MTYTLYEYRHVFVSFCENACERGGDIFFFANKKFRLLWVCNLLSSLDLSL